MRAPVSRRATTLVRRPHPAPVTGSVAPGRPRRPDPLTGQAGGVATWVLAAALAVWVAALGLAAAEHARAVGESAAAHRAVQAGLLAAQAALARGGPDAAQAAFAAAVAANWQAPGQATLEVGPGMLRGTLAWTYRPAFLPLPPVPARAVQAVPAGEN